MRNLVTLLVISVISIFNISNSAFAEIEISFRFNDAGQKEMRAAIDEFEKKNPGIQVLPVRGYQVFKRRTD